MDKNTMTILIISFINLGILAVLAVISIKIYAAKDRAAIKKIEKTEEKINNTIADEFSRNRQENAKLQQVMRDEININLKDIADKLEKQTYKNYEQQNKMLETVTGNLKEITEANRLQNERVNATLSENITKMQESNEKKLEAMRQTVDEKLTATLKERLDVSFKNVSQNLENVYKSLGEMKELAGGVSDLQRVLTNVKARGTWAEVQLGNILEQTLTPDQYETNVSIKNNGQMVEYAIKIPSRDDDGKFVLLPIDSKFPQEDYIRLSDAAEKADKEGVEKYSKELEKRIREEAVKIQRLYIEVPLTTDFAILFLPTEGLYAEILKRPGLVERIQNENRIMICGPSTITAFLNTLRMGFRTIAIDKRATEVWRVLGATKTQYDQFETVLVKAKKKIDEAGNVLEDAQKRNNIIRKKLRTVEAVESDDAFGILGLDGEAEAGIDNEVEDAKVTEEIL